MKDDHGPKAGCKWNECGLGDFDNCPFGRDDWKNKKPSPSRGLVKLHKELAELEPHCQHEWHQVSNDLDHRVYCIFCLEIEKLAIPSFDESEAT